ncbi:sulfate permease [Aeromicrobium piscarium]|uniref:sulfate permease n=1 Tax=Aeromicrobium piscarium TaxID=2590901 RepID=UPI00163D9D77|nr:sulfate permease [Aeromicrobium piscarium]
MLGPILAAVTYVYVFVRTWAPSNIVLDLIRTRSGLKWGVPAMAIAVPYLAIAYWNTTLIDDGGPGLLHLVVLWGIWNGIKFFFIGPVSLVQLAIVRVREHRARSVPIGTNDRHPSTELAVVTADRRRRRP